jgi:hypothetical protein
MMELLLRPYAIGLFHAGPDVDIDIWASEDGGRFWQKRGVAALHEPGTSQEQSASGIAHDGSRTTAIHNAQYQVICLSILAS